MWEGDEQCSNSILANGAYPAGKHGVPFTTCRKFKGHEADEVIMVDVEASIFIGDDGQNVMLFYVGAPRARLRLDIISGMGDEDATRVLQSLGKSEKIKRPSRDLARALNDLPVMET